MSRPVLPAVLLGFALLMTSVEARAQFSFTALDGIPAAKKAAQEGLGNDAELVFIGAPGSFDYQGLNLSFDIESGESNIWGYVFYSPSAQEFTTLAVIKIFIFQALDVGLLPFSLPEELVTPADTTGTWADSDRMIERLRTDTAFQKYQQDLPEALPNFVSFGQMMRADSLDLPNGFPVGQGTWTVSFSGAKDSTMTCFVASKTGETFCRRIYGIPTSSMGNSHPVTMTKGDMQVLPNPATSQARITITGYDPSTLRNSKLGLYNVRGELVQDLTESFRAGYNNTAEFSVEDLPSGTYRCILAGEQTWNEVGMIVVE